MPDELKRGRCLIFAWGPPWHWLPRIQRSKSVAPGGISLTWLWFGLYWVPKPVAWLLVGAGIYWLREAERAAVATRPLE